jgi:hypothetical protein
VQWTLPTAPHYCKLGEIDRLSEAGILPKVIYTAWLLILFPGYEDLTICQVMGMNASAWIQFKEVCRLEDVKSKFRLTWLDSLVAGKSWPKAPEWKSVLKVAFTCPAQRMCCWDRLPEFLSSLDNIKCKELRLEKKQAAVLLLKMCGKWVCEEMSNTAALNIDYRQLALDEEL